MADLPFSGLAAAFDEQIRGDMAAQLVTESSGPSLRSAPITTVDSGNDVHAAGQAKVPVESTISVGVTSKLTNGQRLVVHHSASVPGFGSEIDNMFDS